jgi:hypothetical protein
LINSGTWNKASDVELRKQLLPTLIIAAPSQCDLLQPNSMSCAGNNVIFGVDYYQYYSIFTAVAWWRFPTTDVTLPLCYSATRKGRIVTFILILLWTGPDVICGESSVAVQL